MQAAEFSELRESLGLSLDWMSARMQYPVQLLHAFESENKVIPSGLCVPLQAMDAYMTRLADKAADAYMAVSWRHRSDDPLWLVGFSNDVDLWHFEPGMQPYPATFHSALLNRMAKRIVEQGKTVVQWVVERGPYTIWLSRHGVVDSYLARVLWAKSVYKKNIPTKIPLLSSCDAK